MIDTVVSSFLPLDSEPAAKFLVGGSRDSVGSSYSTEISDHIDQRCSSTEVAGILWLLLLASVCVGRKPKC